MLTIDDPELERLVRQEAARRGESEREVLRRALGALGGPSEVVHAPALLATPEEQARRDQVIREIQDRMAQLPVLDPRPAEEILGYGENGLPG